jgi:hypothetical protein
MTFPRSFLSNNQVETLLPAAADAAGRASPFVSLKGAAKVSIIAFVNQGNAAPVTFSLVQATNVAGAGVKALANSAPISFDQNTAIGDATTLGTAGVSFTTDATIFNKMVVFDVDPALLDVNNGFDCIGVTTGASNAANVTTVLAVLMGTRYGSGSMSAQVD